MRILLVCGSYPPIRCGVGDYTSILTDELACSGDIEVGVLTNRDASADGMSEKVEVLTAIDSWTVRQLPTIMRSILGWKPDLVHIQFPSKGYGTGKGPLFLPLLLGLRGIPVVQTWHEPLGWLRSLRYLPCALTRDALVVVEPDYAALVPAWLGRLLRRKPIFRSIPVGSNIPSRELSTVERARLKESFDAEALNLVAYFGFVAPPKGVELLFEVADPDKDRLLLICDLDPSDSYQKAILDLVAEDRWRGKAFVTGYRPPDDVARLLAAADIAVYPFVKGVTRRNASVLAARAQGTAVLTTSHERHGFDEGENSFYAAPGDRETMRQALRRLAGHRAPAGAVLDWSGIAALHRELYRQVLRQNGQTD